MVTTVFWFLIGYCITNQRYLLLITNFDSCMYMNFFISCVKGSVHTNSVDLVLSFLSVKIGLISYHFVPQHEVIKYFFFWINIIWIEHLIHLKLKTLDQQYANVKRLQTEDFNICIVFLRELLLFDDLTCIKIDHS